MITLTDKEFVLLRDFLKANYGISLGNEKKSLVYSRLRSVLAENNFTDFTEYFKYISEDKSGKAISIFIDKLTTNHTYFMREADHFYFFRDNVLPYIEEKYASTKDLRLWCAGCSSGEEAYTLQIILQEYFKNKPGWNTEILATDIAHSVLSAAIQGIYKNETLAPMPEMWKKQYFSSYDKNNSVVSDVLKKNVIFRKFNLMENKFKFKKPFQVIFCRNVMIYFDIITRERLINQFYEITDNGGYLFLGHSESISQMKCSYTYIEPAVYRK